MTPEQFKRLDTLFAEGQQVPVSERAAWLDRACPDDPLVRAELAAMLEGENKVNSERTSDVLGGAIQLPTPPLPRPINLGEGFGPYKILGTIGEGGFGVVYLAEQTGAVRRRVALKVLKAGMDSAQVVARFDAERQALALMNHPNVAKVFDGGLTPPELGSRPYFAMEHVAGVPINEYCDAQKLSVRERLELMIHVCDAIQHAHQKGIIHRDIKPSNILVTLEERTEGGGGGAHPVPPPNTTPPRPSTTTPPPPPEPTLSTPNGSPPPTPKVIDFGIAKAIARPLTDRTLYTEVGQLIGTPAYMSPEQAGTTGLDIDTRTDVYSLGVVLYELIVGALPFDPATLRAAGHNEILRIIREVDPPRPSTRLSSLGAQSTEVAARRRTVLDRLRSELRRELEWIPLKAMEKDRQRRYGSAADLARDLQNYLHNRPLLAGPPSRIYQARKFVRRNRGPVAAAAALTVALVAGVVGTSLGFASAIDQRNQAVAAGEREKKEKDNARAAEAEAQEQRAAAELQRDQAERESYVANLFAADAALSANDLTAVRRRLRSAPERLRGWEWRYLLARSDRSALCLSKDDEIVTHLAGGIGDVASTLCEDGLVRRWNLAEPAQPPAEFRPPVTVVRGTAILCGTDDGRRLACGSGSGELHLWLAESPGEWRTLTGHSKRVDAAVFSPDGSMLATGGIDRSVRIWNTTTGQPMHVMENQAAIVKTLAFSPDGRLLASGAWETYLRLWDTATGEARGALEMPNSAPTLLAFSPDGRRLACVSMAWLCLWDVQTQSRLVATLEHKMTIHAMAFSPAGDRIATAGGDREIMLWDGVTGRKLSVIRTGNSAPRTVEFSPDGSRIAAATEDGMIRVWETQTGREATVLRGHVGKVVGVRFNTAGDRLLSAGADGTLRTWDPSARGEVRETPGNLGSSRALARLGESGFLVSAPDWSVRGFDGRTGDLTAVYRGLEDSPSTIAVGDDGRVIGAAESKSVFRMWDGVTGASMGGIRLEGALIAGSDLSPDGTAFSVAINSKPVLVYETASRTRRSLLEGHDNSVLRVAFGADGRWCASASADGTARVWSLDDQSCTAVCRGHRGWISALAISPDQQRIATGGLDDRSVRVWDRRTGEPVAELSGHAGSILSLAFSPDGTRLVSGSQDQTARLWDTSVWGELLVVRDGSQPVRGVAFSADGNVLAVLSDKLRFYDAMAVNERRRANDAWSERLRKAGAVVDRAAAAGELTARTIDQAIAQEGLSPSERRDVHEAVRRRVLLGREQAAGTAADAAMQRHVFVSDAAAAISADASLDELTRQWATLMVKRIEDHPGRLMDDAWRLVRRAGMSAEEYALGLRAAEQGMKSGDARIPEYHRRLGVARYRNGQYEGALESLQKARQLTGANRSTQDAVDWAFSAMALAKQQKPAEAAEALEKLRELLKQPAYANQDYAKACLREAEAVVGNPPPPPTSVTP